MSKMAPERRTDAEEDGGLQEKLDEVTQSWWFAGTAIPLLAATIGPMANVLSIAALVTKWRVRLPDNGQLPGGADDNGVPIADPRWEIVLNAVSLAAGFFGNFCLLLNFTKRVRYIVALPLTIAAWFLATGLLIGIIVAVDVYTPPHAPGETYSQGYWHAVIAAVLYLLGAVGLMVNILGYFLRRYSEHFELDDDQRTLILQTMMFFIWLAGGAAVFSSVGDITFANALYFADVTILTVGFGDIVMKNDLGRGLVMPYALLGIIFLGLMIKSIRNFAISMSKDQIVKGHQVRTMERTLDRTVSSEKELCAKLGLPPRPSIDSADLARRQTLSHFGKVEKNGRVLTLKRRKRPVDAADTQNSSKAREVQEHAPNHGFLQNLRKDKIFILREEKDRFEAMRIIQERTKRFRQYYSLSMSVLATILVWILGAVIFWKTEHRMQDMTYFQALYFCYVSLLTIGYGDFAPKSNAGKPFFVVWSLLAVPTITLLISDMGDTVVASINRGTFTLADWTVLPKRGVVHDFLAKHDRIRDFVSQLARQHDDKERIAKGFQIADPDADLGVDGSTTLEDLANETPETTEHDLARKLAVAIRKVSNDVIDNSHKKRYSYEEWVIFIRLIRFSSPDQSDGQAKQEEDSPQGLIDWDWLGEGSPMLADASESQWLLERLCESLSRYTLRQVADVYKERLATQSWTDASHLNPTFPSTRSDKIVTFAAGSSSKPRPSTSSPGDMKASSRLLDNT